MDLVVQLYVWVSFKLIYVINKININISEYLRDSLLENGSGVSNNDEQKQRLLDNSETLERSSERLTQGYRVALETEQIGAMILNDLNNQRQTITNARDRVSIFIIN